MIIFNSFNNDAGNGILKTVAAYKTGMKEIAQSVVPARTSISELEKTVSHLRKSVQQLAKNAQGLGKSFSNMSKAAGGSLRNVGADINATTGRISGMGKALGGLRHDITRIGNATAKSISKIGGETGGIIKQFKSLAKVINKTSLNVNIGFGKKGEDSGGILSSIKKTLGKGLGAAGKFVGGKALAFAGDTMKTGLAGASTPDGYKSMAGEEKGGALYKDVGNFARSTVYGPALHDTAKGMLELGMNAEQVMPAMRMLGDVAGGNQEKMDMLSVAFAKTATSGKLSREEFEEYKKAGFDPLEGIAKATGANYSDLQKQMDAGGISSGQVNSALASATGEGGQFNGGLAKAAQTPEGMVQNLQNTVEQAQIEFGVALAPAISTLLTALQPLMDHLPVFFQALQPIVETLFVRLGELMPPILDLVDAVFTMIKPILDLLVSPEITQLLKNFIDLATVIANVLTPVVKLVAYFIGQFVGAINTGVQRIKNLFGGFMKNHPAVAEGLKSITKRVDKYTGSKDPDLTRKPALVTVAEKTPVVSTGAGNWKAAPTQSKPEAKQITGGGQKIIRINFRNVVEKMYNTVADTTGLVNTIEPRLDEAINRILAGVS